MPESLEDEVEANLPQSGGDVVPHRQLVQGGWNEGVENTDEELVMQIGQSVESAQSSQ
jgi:hypothetical protein